MTATDPIVCRYVWDDDVEVDGLMEDFRVRMRGPERWLVLVFLGMILAALSFLTAWLPIAMHHDPNLGIEKRVIGWALNLGFFGILWGMAVSCLFKRDRLRPAFKWFRGGLREPRLVTWSFDDEQVGCHEDLATTTIRWAGFRRVVETSNGFLLYEGSGNHRWLPGRGFGSQAEVGRFAELARARVEDRLVLGECRFVGKPKPVESDEF